jgi:hypothetical protein
MLIGIPSSGSAGIINCISRWADGSIVAGVFCILATVGWGLQGLAFLWMYKQVRPMIMIDYDDDDRASTSSLSGLTCLSML